MLVTQSCLTLGGLMDCSPPGSSVHGILQARTGVGLHSLLQGIFPTQGSNLGLLHCRQTLYPLSHQGSPKSSLLLLLLLQSCPALCNPIDGSPLGSSVPGILQARILEWVAISFSNAWKWKVKVKSLSRAWLLATPWIAAYQATPSMGYSRQEYWSGVPLLQMIMAPSGVSFSFPW